MQNNSHIITEGIATAESGMEAALKSLQEMSELLKLDMTTEKEIRVVKELAHQLNSYAFWMEQKEFWTKRQSFQLHVFENMRDSHA